jgi:hypothetical protein
LTLRLIAIPELAWPRLNAAVDRGERLPSPITHASAVAGVSVLATVVGTSLRASATVGSATIAALAATAGHLGAAVLAAQVGPMLLPTSSGEVAYRARYAAAAALPAVACGVINIVPLHALGVLAALGGTALCWRSASLGARDFLGIEGGARRRATIVVTALAATPVLLATAFRLLA